jgi:hypothetical protein
MKDILNKAVNIPRKSCLMPVKLGLRAALYGMSVAYDFPVHPRFCLEMIVLRLFRINKPDAINIKVTS